MYNEQVEMTLKAEVKSTLVRFREKRCDYQKKWSRRDQMTLCNRSYLKIFEKLLEVGKMKKGDVYCCGDWELGIAERK